MITARFYDAFTSKNNVTPNIDILYDVFRSEARIFKALDGSRETYDVAGFVEPRRKLLSSGRISQFREWEVEAQTHAFGNIAHRFSSYKKAWTEGTERCEGGGMKSLQFVFDAEGWKIASLTWDDADIVRASTSRGGVSGGG